MTTPTSPLSDESPNRITPSKALQPDQVIKEQPGTQFESYMKKGTPPQGAQTGGATGVSHPNPMELTKPTSFQTAGPSFDSLVAQAKSAQDTLGSVGKQLQNPNLKLKRSQTHLLRNKLSDAHDHMNAAAEKLGLDPSQIKSSGRGGHMEKFLTYINAGQDQFAAIQQKLKEMSSSGEPINPSDMLLLQSKMGVAQQEIEYASTLLSKVTDSIKQIMSVQL